MKATLAYLDELLTILTKHVGIILVLTAWFTGMTLLLLGT